MSRDNSPKNIDHLPPPPGFSDAECCLYCLHAEHREGSSNFLNCRKYKTICEDTSVCNEVRLEEEEDEMSQDETSLTDPLHLAISMLEECDRWACDALTKYIHKINMLETKLSVSDVYTHQQKIRIVIKKLKGEED